MSEQQQDLPQSFEYGKDGPGSLVVGIDGSPTSINAFSYAIGVARRQHAKLLAIYVWPYRGATVDPVGYINSAVQETAADTAKLVSALSEQAEQEFGVPISCEIRHGDPCKQLIKAAEGCRADQIIIGASAGFAHRYLGSLAARISRHSHTPITVVP